MVLIAAIASAGGLSCASGPGFHCTGHLCWRAEVACQGASDKFTGGKPCVQRERAYCYTVEDTYDLHYALGCLTTQSECESDRLDSKRRHQDLGARIKISECKKKR